MPDERARASESESESESEQESSSSSAAATTSDTRVRAGGRRGRRRVPTRAWFGDEVGDEELVAPNDGRVARRLT